MDIIASNSFLENYFPLIVFLIAAGTLSCIMIGLGFIRGPHQPNPEKLSPYECGFDNFSDARIKFNIKYYLIAILFILFDLEIALIFPWAVALDTIGSYGFWSMIVFLSLMIIGFIYEWGKGALNWE